jgi:hypothetical protein
MRDALNDFGSVSQTTGTLNFPNVLDFGPIDARAPMQSNRTGEQHDCTAVFQIDTDLTVAFTAIKLQHSDDNSTFTDLFIAPVPFAATAKAGDRIVFKFPLEHKRYVRAAAVSGTLAASPSNPAVSAWLEPGPSLS